MHEPAAIPPRSRPERLLAWLLTGPLGHLIAFLCELAVAWLRWAGGGVRRRLTWRVERRVGCPPIHHPPEEPR
ncbi:MAG TPA: hypothetical protein VK387_00865 [Thermoleophilaceae bacterium]|nr:hypothetical protein [Thermoleophilaceae bacterium]